MVEELIQQAAGSPAAGDAAAMIARAVLFAEISMKSRIAYQKAASQ